MNKKLGAPRFAGYGRTNRKWDPQPGSVEWYKANMPERFNNTMINIRNAGYDQQFSEQAAARVLAWSEKPLASMRFENKKCPGCGFNLEHCDKPFPKWDQKQRE